MTNVDILLEENQQLTRQVEYMNMAVAKANLLDVLIEEKFILPSMLEIGKAKLDDLDQLEIKRAYDI